MNKTLRYSFVALMAMFMGSAFAQKEVVIDFNSMSIATSCSANADKGIEASDAGDINETYKVVADDNENVVILISPKKEEATNPNRFWQTNSGPQLRCYSGTITIQAKFAMKSIIFDAPSKFNVTANVGTLSSTTWSGDATEVIFTVNGNSQINKITISGEASGNTDPDPQTTEAKKVTIAEFNAAEESTEVWYQLTGTVKNLKDNDQYGNFDLEDETGSVYVYGLLSEKGGEKKKFQELVAAKGIKNGDKLTIIGTRGSYNNKIEVLNAYFVSVESSGENPDPQPSEELKVVTVAEFNAAAESTNIWYQLTGTVNNLKDGDQYGNFDLVDETGSVYVYGLLSEKGGEKKKFQELAAAQGIQEGSKITIIGNRGSYKDKIEVTNAYFVSIDTRINDLKADKAVGAIYNLAGQRVDANYKGVVIQNGKKFVVK